MGPDIITKTIGNLVVLPILESSKTLMDDSDKIEYGCKVKNRGNKTHPKSRNIKKHRVYTNFLFFKKFV